MLCEMILGKKELYFSCSQLHFHLFESKTLKIDNSSFAKPQFGEQTFWSCLLDVFYIFQIKNYSNFWSAWVVIKLLIGWGAVIKLLWPLNLNLNEAIILSFYSYYRSTNILHFSVVANLLLSCAIPMTYFYFNAWLIIVTIRVHVFLLCLCTY